MPRERMRPWTRVRSGRDRSRFQASASALLFVCAGVDTAGPSLGSVLWRRWGSLVQAFPVHPPSPPWVPHLGAEGGGGEDGTLPAHSFPPRILLGGRGGPLSSHACTMPGTGHTARRLLASQDDREINTALALTDEEKFSDSSNVTQLGSDRAQTQIQFCRMSPCHTAPLRLLMLT